MGRLTAPEYLRFVGRMYGLERETVNRRTEELLEFMQLADERRKLITDFSHGMQKKLALAAAVIHGPRVLFLDEPFEGVDAIAAGHAEDHAAGNDQSGRDDLSDYRTCWRLWSGCAVTWRSFTRDGWWPTARSRICARVWRASCRERKTSSDSRWKRYFYRLWAPGDRKRLRSFHG